MCPAQAKQGRTRHWPSTSPNPGATEAQDRRSRTEQSPREPLCPSPPPQVFRLPWPESHHSPKHSPGGRLLPFFPDLWREDAFIALVLQGRRPHSAGRSPRELGNRLSSWDRPSWCFTAGGWAGGCGWHLGGNWKPPPCTDSDGLVPPQREPRLTSLGLLGRWDGWEGWEGWDGRTAGTLGRQGRAAPQDPKHTCHQPSGCVTLEEVLSTVPFLTPRPPALPSPTQSGDAR